MSKDNPGASCILEKKKADSPKRKLDDLAPRLARELLTKELNEKAELMLDSTPEKPERGFKVFRAFGKDIPQTLLELGTLREQTFRTVGEGTGLSRDNDSFDLDYDHFICWDKKLDEVTGAYRIGRVDRILKEKGTAGIYTNTLFNLEELLHTDFKEGTLEAGRSFVRPEFQRGLTLMMIWAGMSRFIAANPEYKYLIGPVSISNEFQENSKHLMVSYLMKNYPHEKSDKVSSKNPPNFDSDLSPDELTHMIDQALNLQNLQEVIRQEEDNPRAQIPQLIKLYLELGVRFLAFNKDDDFNSIDGLIWLDVTQIPPDIITRYMGEENWTEYSKYHLK